MPRHSITGSRAHRHFHPLDPPMTSRQAPPSPKRPGGPSSLRAGQLWGATRFIQRNDRLFKGLKYLALEAASRMYPGRFHTEAAKHHEAGNHEKAAHHANTAHGHMSHACEYG
jgi:hypothetical protein